MKQTAQSPRLSLLLLAAVTLSCGNAAHCQKVTSPDKKECATPQIVTDSKYAPGQVWTYKTRPNENSSKITILRVEGTPKLGTIIHIRIDNVRIKSCSDGSYLTSIEHAPFSKAAIDRSIIDLVKREEKLPDFRAGYSDWLTHCGGVYTIAVAEAVAADETALNSGQECAK